MDYKKMDRKIMKFEKDEMSLRREILETLEGEKDIVLGLSDGEEVKIKEIKYKDIILDDGMYLNITTQDLIRLFNACYLRRNNDKEIVFDKIKQTLFNDKVVKEKGC